MKDKISIIISTYNREKYILESINSCLNQTYSNIEVIVVDDCSTDNTHKVISKINDGRLKYIKLNENKGACYARNIGIKNSKGKYIVFNDSDDIFRKDKIEKQLNNLKKNNSDLDFCKLVEHSINGDNEFPSKIQENNLKKRSVLEELCYGNIISTQTILAKRKVFDDILFDESLPRLQDYDLVIRIACKYKISHTKEVLVDMYKQDNSISKSYDKLEKACILMIKKNYDIGDEKIKLLNKSLISLLNKDEIDQCKIKYENMLNKERFMRKDAERQLNEIINSKRWKLINKIFSIRDK